MLFIQNIMILKVGSTLDGYDFKAESQVLESKFLIIIPTQCNCLAKQLNNSVMQVIS
jgi:hypothetical protein